MDNSDSSSSEDTTYNSPSINAQTIESAHCSFLHLCFVELQAIIETIITGIPEGDYDAWPDIYKTLERMINFQADIVFIIRNYQAYYHEDNQYHYLQ